MALQGTTKAACRLDSSSCVDEYIYQRPIRVPDASSHHPDDCDRFQITISFILTFNLALAHHRAGLENHDLTMRQANLQKALHFYSFSQQLVEQQDQGYAASALVLLLLALTNNRGQIYKTLGDTDHAYASFHHLLETLFYLNDCEWESSNRQSLLEGFYQSTIHLILTKSHTAEAA
jgi:hypothetical protein